MMCWINLIINLSMLQKTQMSEVSTNADAKTTTSFFTPRNREMFRHDKKSPEAAKSSPEKNSNAHNFNDLLILTPKIVNILSWPQLYLIDGEITATVKGNFYEIGGLRGSKKFVARGSQIDAELVYFWAEKPTRKINMTSVERYLRSEGKSKELWLHINISKFDPESHASESSDFHLCCSYQKEKKSQIWDFCALQLIDSCRKGIMIMKVLNQGNNSHYKCLLLDLAQKAKIHEAEIGEEKKMNIVPPLFALDLNFEEHLGREEEKVLKTIKSEFGDIVLLVTNSEIYEIEVEDMGEGLKLHLKEYNVFKSIISAKVNVKPLNQGQENRYTNLKEEILDVRFMSNGLKLMILTTFGQIYLVEANNLLSSQNIKDLMLAGQFSDKYIIDSFAFTRLYPVNGTIAVEFHSQSNENLLKNVDETSETAHLDQLTKGLLIVKLQGNSLSCSKIINLYLDPKELIYLSIRQCEAIDQMVLQYIQKKSPEVVEVYKCRTLVMEINALTKLGENYYNYSKRMSHPHLKVSLAHFHPNEEEKLYLSVEFPTVSRTFYLLRDRELTCYKFFSDLDCEKAGKEFSCLFSHSFFQKSLKISVNPLTLQFVVVFKEFVKFCYFDYYQIKNYYTLKIKNVADVKFVGRGEKIVLACSDGSIYLLDSYTLTEAKLMEFYGEVSQVHVIDERRLVIKSCKNVLNFFQKEVDGDYNEGEFRKAYDIKLEEGDLYIVNDRQVVVFRKSASIQVYTHVPQDIPSNITETEQECFLKLKLIHPNMDRQISSPSFEKEEMATNILLSEEFGFLLVATNKGNIKQFLWPLQDPSNPNPPEVLTQQVSSHKILSISIDAKLTNLYVISDNAMISQFQIAQFINGEQMPYIYAFSEKTRDKEMQKRELVDRTYFIDSYTPTEITMTENNSQIIGELQFFIDKLKDDLEQMTKALASRGKVEERSLKEDAKQDEKMFKLEAKDVEQSCKGQIQKIQCTLDKHEREFDQERRKEEQKYQKSLLELYRESDRLNNILKSQDQKMTQEQYAFRTDFEQRMKQLQKEMDEEQNRLENQYKEIEEKRRLSILQNSIENEEEETQMQLFKATIHRQEQQELDDAEDTKEHFLGQNAKKEKEINNLKHRSNYFQNLILETKVQISQLKKDQEQYDRKKQYLQTELKDKEEVIERIEHQLVQYLKNTEDMKTIKNNHEFQLQEYEKEVSPISENHQKIEYNVKHMNIEIMKEYNEKVQRSDLINELTQRMEKLKQIKKDSTAKKLQTGGKFIRVLEKLVYLSTHPFDGDVRKELREVLEGKEGEEITKRDQDREKQRREGQKLMRYKNMLRREIEEEEKREDHIIKNPHQFYRHHKENTALVREFNELSKAQQLLQVQESKLKEEIKVARANLFHTPLRRVPSLSLHKPAEKKLTPFQRYQEEQTILARKQQETSETKLSRASQSISFLKGLMKEMGQSESKYQKMEVMRERVRTFVNPQMKGKVTRPQEIKKILFGRSRMTSEMLKLK